MIFRLGDDLAVRLPVRAAASPLILHEQTWLPQLAPRLPLPVPVPLRIGVPALGYPWGWSIVPWLPGVAADISEPGPDQAPRLAEFLRVLHQPAPPGVPFNPFRSIPLSQRAATIEPRLERLTADGLIGPEVTGVWNKAVQARQDIAPALLHGDLHPRNVLVKGLAISGIIDWGDLTSGDPATDLASIWMLFADPQVRQVALETYGRVSESTCARAKGWAVFYGAILLETGRIDNPRHATLGARILRQIVESI